MTSLAKLGALPVTRLNGIGDKRAEGLAEMGIETLLDLLLHYPRRYVDRTKLTPISGLREGDDAYFVAVIDSVQTPPGRFIARVSDDTGTFELAFFHAAAFLKQQLTPGRRIAAAGQVKRFRTLQIAHPEWELLVEGQEPRGGMLPVYPLTGDLAEAHIAVADQELALRITHGRRAVTASTGLVEQDGPVLGLQLADESRGSRCDRDAWNGAVDHRCLGLQQRRRGGTPRPTLDQKNPSFCGL